jgi:uncharacterized repeat protein (TIGR01451 family)/CSLREA domain-containing protein
MKHKPMLGIALALFLAASLLAPTPARAAGTITVNTTGDVIDSGDGLCSLREAVIAANTDTASGDVPGECQAGSGADTIEFDPALPLPATFVLTITGPGEDSSLTGDLDILGTVTIVGVGAGNTLIDGDGADRVLEIRPAAHVTFSGVTLQHGDPGPGLDGGGILIDLTGRLTLNEGAVMNNTAAAGGGAMVLGPLQGNGSATLTHALLPGSPAINAGNPESPGSGGDACPGFDQRGVARPQGAACDIGAYERILAGEADLSVTVSDTPDPVNAGAALTYTIAITNGGPDTAHTVTVTDPLPAGVGYGGAAGAGWSCGYLGGTVTCTRPALSAGAAPDIILVVTAPTHGGTLTNTIAISPSELDPDPTDNSATASTWVNTKYIDVLYLSLLVR